LTTTGRVLAHPLDAAANSHGQLGVRRIMRSNEEGDKEEELVPLPLRARGISALPPPPTWEKLINMRQPEPEKGTEAADATPKAVSRKPTQASQAEPVDSGLTYSTHLFEVPSLKGIEIAQIAAGARSSFALTPDGRVLAWGANEYGQLGLGGKMTVDAVTRPSEVVFDVKGGRAVCTAVDCGALIFLMEVVHVTQELIIS
jgi:hypothetical protein